MCLRVCALSGDSCAVASVTRLVVHLEELEFLWGGGRERLAVHPSCSAKGVKGARLCG